MLLCIMVNYNSFFLLIKRFLIYRENGKEDILYNEIIEQKIAQSKRQIIRSRKFIIRNKRNKHAPCYGISG